SATQPWPCDRSRPMHDDDTCVLDAYPSLWRSESWASRPALSAADGGSAISYGALFDRVGAMAGGLRRAGVQPRQLVALAMERSLESVIAILGIMAAGACPCPLEPRLTREEIRDRLRSVGAATVLADAVNLHGLGLVDGLCLLRIEALPEAPPYWADNI